MLVPAQLYKEELRNKIISTWYSLEYQYYWQSYNQEPNFDDIISMVVSLLLLRMIKLLDIFLILLIIQVNLFIIWDYLVLKSQITIY